MPRNPSCLSLHNSTHNDSSHKLFNTMFRAYTLRIALVSRNQSEHCAPPTDAHLYAYKFFVHVRSTTFLLMVFFFIYYEGIFFYHYFTYNEVNLVIIYVRNYFVTFKNYENKLFCPGIFVYFQLYLHN